MALRGVFKDLKNDAGVLVTAAALTTTDYSETLGMGGLASFGVMVDCGAVSGTTSPTLNITPEFSYDSGTTWVANPAVGFDYAKVDVSTDGTVMMGVQQMVTTGDDRIANWRNPFPSDADIKLRFALTIGGTGSPSFTLTAVKFFGRREV